MSMPSSTGFKIYIVALRQVFPFLWYPSKAFYPTNFVFFGRRQNCFLNDRTKLGHFGQKVWNYKLTNTVTARFYTTVRQMTDMSQQKNDRNVSAKKKQSTNIVSNRICAWNAGEVAHHFMLNAGKVAKSHVKDNFSIFVVVTWHAERIFVWRIVWVAVFLLEINDFAAAWRIVSLFTRGCFNPNCTAFVQFIFQNLLISFAFFAELGSERMCGAGEVLTRAEIKPSEMRLASLSFSSSAPRFLPFDMCNFHVWITSVFAHRHKLHQSFIFVWPACWLNFMLRLTAQRIATVYISALSDFIEYFSYVSFCLIYAFFAKKQRQVYIFDRSEVHPESLFCLTSTAAIWILLYLKSIYIRHVFFFKLV